MKYYTFTLDMNDNMITILHSFNNKSEEYNKGFPKLYNINKDYKLYYYEDDDIDTNYTLLLYGYDDNTTYERYLSPYKIYTNKIINGNINYFTNFRIGIFPYFETIDNYNLYIIDKKNYRSTNYNMLKYDVYYEFNEKYYLLSNNKKIKSSK